MNEDHKKLQRLLETIYRERGFDFREYKETTLTRRLSRRLRARGAQGYADYAIVLDEDPSEYDKLFDDLTINVTSFFRDKVVFKVLEEAVLPALIRGGYPDGQHKRNTGARRILQVWSAGCATGQEPYSIAMLLLEMLGQEINQWNITILGTDIDAKALQRAREGVFTPKEVESLRPAWLDRYFVPESNGFRVQSTLRELVTFKEHSLVSNPPYHDLDLLVCRNVLIYFTPTLQTRVLKGFHEGLKKGGFLLLGQAEVPVGETRRLFHRVDRKAKLYRKLVSDAESQNCQLRK